MSIDQNIVTSGIKLATMSDLDHCHKKSLTNYCSTQTLISERSIRVYLNYFIFKNDFKIKIHMVKYIQHNVMWSSRSDGCTVIN